MPIMDILDLKEELKIIMLQNVAEYCKIIIEQNKQIIEKLKGVSREEGKWSFLETFFLAITNLMRERRKVVLLCIY